MIKWLPLFLVAVLSLSQAQNIGEDFALFENRIRPLFIEQCYECHSATAKKLKGGLRLDSRDDLLKGGDSGPAIIPGDPERSLLIKAVRHADKDLAMPRGPGGSRKLPEIAIADLVRWVKLGAPYPDTKGAEAPPTKGHWAFQPILKPSVPEVTNHSWAQTSIDPFILAKLEANGLQPA